MASTIIWLRWQDPNKECRRSPLKRHAHWSHYGNTSRIRAILCFRSRGPALGLDPGPGGRCCNFSDFGPTGLEEISRKPQGSGGWDTHPVWRVGGLWRLSIGAASIMGVRLRVDAGLLAI